MATPPQRPSRNHHFNPRSVLRRFSIDGRGKQVWVYDKSTARRFSAGLGGAGSANDYNTLVLPDGEILNFEDAFGDIDGVFAHTGDTLTRNRTVAQLDPAFRAQLADGVVVQFLRTPMVRSTFQALPRQLAARIAEVGLETPAEEEFPTDNDARVESLKFIAERDDLRAALLEKDIILLEPAGDARFWTSDHPVVRVSSAPNGDTGFRAMGVQIYLPVASDLMLGFLCPSLRQQLTHIPLESMRVDPERLSPLIAWRDGLLSGRPVPIDDATVQSFNHYQVVDSRRFLYAARDDFDLADDILSRNPSARAVESMISMGRIGEGFGPSSTIPEGKWLALYGRERTHLIPMITWDPASRVAEVVTDLPALLDDVLGDAPFKSAEFYVDRHALRVMNGGVELIVLDRGRTTRFQVVHSDPSLRALDKLLGQS